MHCSRAADGTKPKMRIKMASPSLHSHRNRNELVFPLILMVLVVFPRTKGLERELLVWQPMVILSTMSRKVFTA